MRIILKDDNTNYLNWGNLVVQWINDPTTWPSDLGTLRRQIAAAHVDATINGPDSRGVSIQQYDDDPTGALEIIIPTKTMFDARMALVKPGPYPRELMPSFVDIAYGGAQRANLSASEAHDFAIRRVGEYTINECC